MSRPIENLVFWCAKLVERITKASEMLEEQPELEENPEFQKLSDTDSQMIPAYLAALKLRAQEVVEYAAKFGVLCTEEDVRENPFLIAAGLMHHIGALNFEEDEDDD